MTIRKLITHANCADGLATAILARYWNPNIEVQFVQHGTQEHAELQPEPGCVFCDMVPTLESAPAWAEAGALVLDHHVHAKETVAVFGERGEFDNERSGALMFFDKFLRGNCGSGSLSAGQIEHFANCVSVRDLWKKNHPLWSSAQSLHRVLMNVHRDLWIQPARIPQSAELFSYGDQMARSEELNAESIVRTELSRSETNGYTFGVCSCGGALSSMVGEKARQAGYDLTACFFYAQEQNGAFRKVVYSLRSSDRVDCGALAKSMGGGGHARAAGFSERLWRVGMDPWARFGEIATEFLERLP